MTRFKSTTNAPHAWLGELPITSRYTYGIAGERFFRALKDEGKILGTRCHKCARTYVPAASFCERCLSPLNDYLDMGTTGEVYTYTLLYENYDGTAKEPPEIVAFVSFGDGGLVHKLAQVEPGDLQIGMEVEAVLKPADQREGSILDIAHFRPVE